MGVVNKRKRIFFLFQNLSVVPKKSTPKKFAYIWHFQGIGISVIQFEKTQIQFKDDFFAAVAVFDAKAPSYRTLREAPVWKHTGMLDWYLD